MNLFNGFLSLFFPCECVFCKRYIKDFKYFFVCENCYEKIKTIKEPFCRICHKPLSSTYIDICEECRERKKTFFDFVYAAGIYESPLKELIHLLKFNYKKNAGKVLSSFILEKCPEEIFKDIDFITFIPLSKKIKQEKEFNHTEIIAKFLSKRKKIEIIDALEKIRETEDQSKLSRERRLTNLKDAFSINKKIKDKLLNKNLLLIDDIYTTGSTLNETSKVLKINGVKKVICLVVARAI